MKRSRTAARWVRRIPLSKGISDSFGGTSDECLSRHLLLAEISIYHQ